MNPDPALLQELAVLFPKEGELHVTRETLRMAGFTDPLTLVQIGLLKRQQVDGFAPAGALRQKLGTRQFPQLRRLGGWHREKSHDLARCA